MTTEIVRASSTPGGALSLGHMTPHDAWLFAETLANSPLLPDAYRKQPASVLWALEYGRALNLDVVTTITTIHVIKGKPTQSADLMLSRARAAGHRVRIKSERTQCVVRIVRADDPEDETVVEWTLDDAVTAGLCELKNGRPWSRSSKGEPQAWEKFPRAMLRARAVSEAVRIACPEVLHGAIYTPEEMGAYVDQDGNPIDAPVTPLRAVRAEPVRDWLAEARAATSAEQVRQIYNEARDTGAPAELAALIAEIGRQKAAGAASAAAVIEGKIVEPGTDERTAAVDALRAAALDAGIADTVEDDFAESYGVTVDEATVEQLREMAEMLRRAA